jgi:hypothetical protein
MTSKLLNLYEIGTKKVEFNLRVHNSKPVDVNSNLTINKNRIDVFLIVNRNRIDLQLFFNLYRF